MKQDFTKFFRNLLKVRGSTGYAYGPIQSGKTRKMLEAAALAHAAGYTPIIMTQPDLRLRDQGHADAINAASRKINERAPLNYGLDATHRKPFRYDEVNSNTFRGRSLIFDIMSVPRVKCLIDKLDELQEEDPVTYSEHVAGKLVIIQDEADLFLTDLELLARAAPTGQQEEKLLANIRQMETALDRLVLDAHAVLKVSATICTNMLVAIKQDRAPSPETVYVESIKDPDYQDIQNFIHYLIDPIDRPFDFSKDKDLIRFVKAVLDRQDEPIALVNVHKHTAQHCAVKQEIESYIEQNHADKCHLCEIIEVNNRASTKQTQESIASLISSAHQNGKKFIFVVGGRKLDRGIRCASANVFGTEQNPGDGRHATDHFMRPAAKLVLPALLQQMRLSGRYPGSKPRRLWLTEADYQALQEYVVIQNKILAELQKPFDSRVDLIPLSERFKQFLSGGMVLLMSERHKKFAGDTILSNFSEFSTMQEAQNFCKRQRLQFTMQSDILWREGLNKLDDVSRTNAICDELAQHLGSVPRLRVLKDCVNARNQGRRWRSEGECIDLGHQEFGGKVGDAILISYFRAKDITTQTDAEIRVELNGDNKIMGFRVTLKTAHVKLVT